MSLTDLRYRVLVVVRAQGRSFADHGQKHHSVGAVDIVVIVSYVDVVVVVVILKDGGLTPGQTSKYFFNSSIAWSGLVCLPGCCCCCYCCCSSWSSSRGGRPGRRKTRGS